MATISGRAKFSTAREAAFGDITSSFTRMGTEFESQPRVVFVQNFTNQVMDFSISFAGDSTCFSLSPGDKFVCDITANGAGNEFTPTIGESCWVKARSALPGSGFVQFSSVVAV
jgi:hypothetical protein